MRRKCIEENAKDYAYISFLHTYDYIMPRGASKNRQGRLIKQLSVFEYRFGPGRVPVCFPTAEAAGSLEKLLTCMLALIPCS